METEVLDRVPEHVAQGHVFGEESIPSRWVVHASGPFIVGKLGQQVQDGGDLAIEPLTDPPPRIVPRAAAGNKGVYHIEDGNKQVEDICEEARETGRQP